MEGLTLNDTNMVGFLELLLRNKTVAKYDIKQYKRFLKRPHRYKWMNTKERNHLRKNALGAVEFLRWLEKDL